MGKVAIPSIRSEDSAGCVSRVVVDTILIKRAEGDQDVAFRIFAGVFVTGMDNINKSRSRMGCTVGNKAWLVDRIANYRHRR